MFSLRRPSLSLLMICAGLAGCPDDSPATHDLAPDLALDLAPDRPREAAAPDRAPDRLSDDARTWLKGVTCATPPPAGAKLAAAPPAYSGGACPTLKAGVNLLQSGGQRQFILVLPKDLKAGERPPLLFMWHWLAGDAKSFLQKAQVQQAADKLRFIAVIPDAKKDIKLFDLLPLPWPFTSLSKPARHQEEYKFFDDMLACVSRQFSPNKECVATIGVSAGALFSAQLVGARSQYLSSLVSLSGGVQTAWGGTTNPKVLPWTAPAHKLPALVLWGGKADSCILLNFDAASKELELKLKQGGHFLVECIHNCKHGEPPLVPPAGTSKYEPFWDFALRHPFWLQPGHSPYAATGWQTNVIPWCGIGAGSATPRTGTCPPPGCPM